MNRPFDLPVYRVELVRERTHPAERKRIDGPATVYAIVSSYLAGVDREHFVALLLNTQHEVLGINTITVGILDASIVHPREVFKPAIRLGAGAILLAHNHPSGDPFPSQDDREITRQVVDAGKIIGIPVLDHVVIGEGRYVSFVEAGLMAAGGAQ